MGLVNEGYPYLRWERADPPALVGITQTRIELVSIPYGEYQIVGGEWQTDPLFKNLQPGKTYTFQQRYNPGGFDPWITSEASEFTTLPPVTAVLRYLGIGMESQFGVEVLADYHVDIASSSLDSPSDPNIPFTGGSSRGNRKYRPSSYLCSGGVEFPVDVNTIGLLLALLFNQVEVTGPDGGGIYTYTFVPNRHDLILPSATMRLGKDNFEHVFPGCIVNQLDISVDNELAMIAVDVQGGKDKFGTLKPFHLLNLTESFPLAFHETVVTIGEGAGNDRSADIDSVNIGFNNNASTEEGTRMGSRFPAAGYAGDFEVTLNMDIVFETMEEKEIFWGHEDGPGEHSTTETEATVKFDAGDAGHLLFTFPRIVFAEVPVQPSGRDKVVQSVSCRVFVDSVLQTEVTAELKSAINYDFSSIL